MSSRKEEQQHIVKQKVEKHDGLSILIVEIEIFNPLFIPKL